MPFDARMSPPASVAECANVALCRSPEMISANSPGSARTANDWPDRMVTSDAPTTAAPTTVAPSTPDPTGFSATVMPLLAEHCASCHTGDGPGTAHVPMNTAGDLGPNTEKIAFAVAKRAMPPWLASDAGLTFMHDPRLTEDQIRAIVDWVDGGAALDVPADTAITPTGEPLPSVEPDVQMTGAPYRGTLADEDDYRCQLYDPKLTETSFLQGMQFEPDQAPVVHHALLFTVDAGAVGDAQARDAESPEAGFPCPGLPRFGRDSRLIMSWAPGEAPMQLPADTGIEMHAGDQFMMQIHYHYSDETASLPEDASRVVADFAGPDVLAAAGGTLQPIDVALYLGPAEIPCSADQSGPLCDRDAAIADLSGSEDALAQFAANAMLLQCGKTVADYAAMTTGVASSTCDLPARPGRIVSLWGHLHQLGASIRLTLNPGRADERILLDIPSWDFNWQLLYNPVDDVVIHEGDTIRVDCSWDRSLADNGKEPRYILWSEGTESEMCFSQIITRPA